MAIREGKWKCAYCGGINLGRDNGCNACGRVRGDDVEFFLEDDAAEVSDAAQLADAGSGADWTCEYCDTNNRANDTVCKQCGAERGDSASLQQKVTYKEGEGPGQPPGGPPSTAGAASAKKRSPLPFFFLAGLAVAAVVALVWFFFIPSETQMELVSGSWTRTITIEEKQWVEEEAWLDQIPPGAQEISRDQEKRTTEKVQVGTETKKVGTKDLGNGYFEDVYEDVPVYEQRDVMDTKVRYRIQQWTLVERISSAGTLDEQPEWASYQLYSGQREGGRSKTIQLVFRKPGKEKQYTFTSSKEELLNTLEKGNEYTVSVNRLGAILGVKTEQDP